jgi:DNA-binding CsgD family transcriptional regulator
MAQGAKLNEALRRDIARLLKEEKLTGNQIAKQLGISRSATQDYIKQLKQDLPPRDGPRPTPVSDPAPIPPAPPSKPTPVAFVIDEEFRSLIPPLTPEARGLLEESLLAEGCRDPLPVWPQPDGPSILFDGHNRYEICQQHDLPFAVIEVQGIATRDEAKVWIIRTQLGRRNLTDFQRIELAERLRSMLEQKARDHQGARTDLRQNVAGSQDTKQAIAAIAGVSRETVRKAEVIMEECDEPTKEALRRGKRKIHGVYQSLRRPRRSSNGKAIADASATMPGAPTDMEPGLRVPMSERLIELAGAILAELANWRQQYPQDSAVGAFALMEKHLRELQGYFRQKRDEMAKPCVTVEVVATGTAGQ